MHPSLLFFLVLPACNLTPKPDTEPPLDDSGTPSGPLTIAEIRGGAVADGDMVTVEDAVVTSPVTRDGEGFFIQDQAGGARSGLYVWYQSGMDPFVVAEGDTVKITGTISEYYGWTELVIAGLDAIEKTGTASVPAPEELGDGAGVNWDDYESVLVSISDQSIESINSYNTALLSSGINLDDGFILMDYGCGGHYDSLTGVIFYQYEEYSINPRYEADLGSYTEGSTVTGTVAEIQQGSACGSVELSGLVATSELIVDSEDGSASLFVQDEGGGQYSGILIYFPDGVEASVTIGDRVNVTGSASEYYDFTELFVSDASTFSVGDHSNASALPLNAAPSDWEPFESVLVTLNALAIEGEQDQYGQASTNYGILIDDELYRYGDLTNGQSWSSVTGLIVYTYGEWKLWPRMESDLVE
jgi:predicted extracellular nuclease